MKKDMRSERLMRVDWDAPRSLDAILELADREHDFGIYQVYGAHVVFGSDALLYIGKARDQTFRARFEQHKAKWLRFESDVRIRVGRLHADSYKGKKADPTWSDWKKAIDCVEELTIYWHSPPYNSKSIVGYRNDAIRVQNWYHRGRLLPEYSSPSGWEPIRPDDRQER